MLFFRQSMFALLSLVTICAAVEFENYTELGYITDIAFQGDTLWAATLGGVLKYGPDNELIATYTTADGLINNFVLCVTVDIYGNKWFGTEHGFCKFDGIKWTPFPTREGIGRVDAICADQRGRVWIGSMVLGVVEADTCLLLDSSDGIPKGTIESIAEDNDGNIFSDTFYCSFCNTIGRIK